MDKLSKITYLTDSAIRSFNEKKCPYCKGKGYVEMDSKYFFTKLLKCTNCNFQYRFPYDKMNSSVKFYQKAYQQKGLTTALPDEKELNKLKEDNFKGTDRDGSERIEILKAFTNGKKIIDYGCSWGYMTYQFKNQGFDVEGLEISKPRAEYGEKNLNVRIHHDETELEDNVDVVFSSHVIEHHPDVKSMIELSRKKLNKDGLFIAFCPNGSADFKKAKFHYYHKLWGKVHPNYLSAEFYKTIFKDYPYYIASTPFDKEHIKKWDKKFQFCGDMTGDELLVACKINDKL